MIYYEFSRVKCIFEINKRVLENRETNQQHLAASRHAMWHANVNMMPSRGRSKLTSAWPLLTSTLIGSIGPRSGARVSVTESHRQVGPMCQHRLKKGKGKTNRFVGSKMLWASSVIWLPGRILTHFSSSLLFLFFFLSSTDELSPCVDVHPS